MGAAHQLLVVWSLLAVLAGASSQTTEAPISQACSDGMSTCLEDYTNKFSSITGLSEFCGVLENLSACLLKIDACNKTLIMTEVIPGAYSVANQQGASCDMPVFPTEPSMNQTEATKTTAKDSSTNSTKPSRSDCNSGLEFCYNEMSVKMANFTFSSLQQYCGFLDILVKCFRGLKECGQNLVENTLIPGTYSSYKQQGIYCNYDQGSETTTETPACVSDARKCYDTLSQGVTFATYSENCRLIYDYLFCMYSIFWCENDYIQAQVDDLVGENLRDCELDSNVASKQASVRNQVWVLTLPLLTLTCLASAFHAWS